MKKCLIGLLLTICLMLAALTGAVATELSDDIYSFQMMVNGQLYALPMTYEALTQLGWELDDDEDVSVDAGYYTMETVKMGDLQAYADFINFDINALPITECYVGGLEFEIYYTDKATDFSLILPGGLAYGEATREDAEAAYGTPSRLYEGSYTTDLTYTYESYREVELSFDVETGKLCGVDVRNFRQPDDFVPGEVSDEVPAIVTRYAAPDAVGETLDSFALSYGDGLYRLPAPVSAFIADGWRLIAEDSEATVSGRDSGWVTLMKDNQRLRTLARNYSAAATSIENCFVTEVESSDSLVMPILCPKGLTVGMGEDDLKAALEGENVEIDEGSSYTCYSAVPGESKLDCYDIYVRDGVVYKIEVSNSPRYADYVGEE